MIPSFLLSLYLYFVCLFFIEKQTLYAPKFFLPSFFPPYLSLILPPFALLSLNNTLSPEIDKDILGNLGTNSSLVPFQKHTHPVSSSLFLS